MSNIDKGRINNKPRVISLYTGGGGLDIGFHKAGFEIIACVEINSEFCKTLELNRQKYFGVDCKIINKDIRGFNPEDFGLTDCDYIIGGPPCQSFSAAGRRAGGVMGVIDSRGSLFELYCRLIALFKPKGFLFENVRGILSANGREDWNKVLDAFSSLGYRVFHRVLDAADYGVPQHRERVILVGTKGKNDFLFPMPTYGDDSPYKRTYRACFEAIEDLQNPDETEHEYRGKYGKLLGEVPPGMNYHYFTKELGYGAPIFAWRSRFSDFLYKAHPEKPVRTIVAKLGAYSGPFHWKNRKFTLNEYKRLFSFPDDYELSGGLSISLQQLGNSVPPAFAEHLAKAVLEQEFNYKIDIELMGSEHILSFDKRKGEKARKTRKHRLGKEMEELPLFSYIKEGKGDKIVTNDKYYCWYINWKKVFRNESRPDSLSNFCEVIENRNGQDVIISVCLSKGGFVEKQLLLEYVLRFRIAIGDGVKRIRCLLYSNSEEDIVAAWDAIEYCINKHSNYLSLMDVYGHFTEPHPLFDLKMNVYDKKESFLLKFAHYFSDFSKLGVDWPASFLGSFYRENEEFNFLSTVKWLRSLRFDVRVNETNPVIKPGFFRCCYSFTTHVDKQISVSWKDNRSGDSINNGKIEYIYG